MSTTTARKDDAAEASVLAQIRKRREELKRDRHVDLDVPGFDGLLVARYQPLAYRKLREIIQRAEKQHRSDPAMEELAGAADVLNNACVGVFVRENGELTPVTYKGEPVLRFDRDCAGALGLDEEQTARDVLFDVFPDEFSVIRQYAAFSEWQARTEPEANEELVGEHEGAI